VDGLKQSQVVRFVMSASSGVRLSAGLLHTLRRELREQLGLFRASVERVNHIRSSGELPADWCEILLHHIRLHNIIIRCLGVIARLCQFRYRDLTEDVISVLSVDSQRVFATVDRGTDANL
jgi:hypothetical protein